MEEARPIYDDRRNSPEESFTGELVDIPGARESRTRWRIDLIAEMPTPRRGIASRARFSRRTGGNVRNLPHIYIYIYIYIYILGCAGTNTWTITRGALAAAAARVCGGNN